MPWALKKVCGKLIITAPGSGGTDFVSRFFGPGVGIDEDPVTGSAHCTLAPYWSARLGKHALRAHQLSPRGGELTCTLIADRVHLTGHPVLTRTGHILVDA